MKKSIVISTVILASLIAIATPNHKTNADTINGHKVVLVDGNKYRLDNDQTALKDGDKLYIDGQEVILAPDALEVTPPETPTQAEPQQQLTPETPIQGVPTPIQETPTPQPTAEPKAPVQGVPTPKQETPQPIYQTPKAPETPQAPTKTPNQPLQQVENVPVKTYPQDNTPLPTQTAETSTVVIEDRPNKSNITQGATETTQKPETFPTTTVKDTEKVEPIKVPTTNKEQVPTNDTKTVTPIKAAADIAPTTQATKEPSKSVKPSNQPSTPKATQTLTQATPVATATPKATLPQTGDETFISTIATLVGIIIIILASAGAIVSRKDNKQAKDFK